MTERMLAKARFRRRQLDEARDSADPEAHNFIDGMNEVIALARIKWQPGTDLQWWTTASRNAALTAYVSAHEFLGDRSGRGSSGRSDASLVQDGLDLRRAEVRQGPMPNEDRHPARA